MKKPPLVLPVDRNEHQGAQGFDEEEMIATGAMVGGAVGYAIGAVAALSCIMVPGCAPAIAMAPAVIGGAATGAAVMGVGVEMAREEEDAADEAAPGSAGKVSNNFQQALALHMYRTLEATTGAGHIPDLQVVAEHSREELLRPDRPEARELLDSGVANYALTAGVDLLYLDNDGRLRLRARTSVRTDDETSGSSSFVHKFVYLPRKSLEEWRADEGRNVADVLIRSLPHIAERLVAERFYLLEVPAAAKPQHVEVDNTSATLYWGESGGRRKTSQYAGAPPAAVELSLREGRAEEQCLSWLMRVSRSKDDNIRPPCLLSNKSHSRSAIDLPRNGQLEFKQLAPCSNYAWSVRDIYDRGDSRRVSEWSRWRSLQTKCEAVKEVSNDSAV